MIQQSQQVRRVLGSTRESCRVRGDDLGAGQRRYRCDGHQDVLQPRILAFPGRIIDRLDVLGIVAAQVVVVDPIGVQTCLPSHLTDRLLHTGGVIASHGVDVGRQSLIVLAHPVLEQRVAADSADLDRLVELKAGQFMVEQLQRTVEDLGGVLVGQGG